MAPRLKPAPSPRTFDADLAAVNALTTLSPTEAEPHLRRFLTHRNNLIVSRAAKITALHQLAGLAEDLAGAFTRLLPPLAADPVKADPQCWAKLELARALAAFEYQSSSLFLAGLRHHQLEPGFGKPNDTAGPLRSTCALALVQCRDLPTVDVLRHLTPLFTDKDLPVRIDCARALEQIGTDHASLLLRLRADLALNPKLADEPELLGTCIGGVLRLDGPRALPWAAAFLTAEDDLAHETAFLLAELHNPAAIPHLTHALAAASSRDFRQTLLTALAATRLPDAFTILLNLATSPNPDSAAARKALTEANPPQELLDQLTSSSQ